MEDKRPVREGLAMLLGTPGEVECVGKYADAESMLARLEADAPDVILMDIGLPGMSGIEATAKVRAERPDTEVVILTVHEDEGNIFKGLCAGACGYLVKDTPPAELIDAIRTAKQGGSPMTPRIARRVVTLFQDRFRPEPRDKVQLTSREQEVLTGLAAGDSYDAIASSLSVATDTVRFHIRNVYRKLQVHSQSAAVARAIREDLI